MKKMILVFLLLIWLTIIFLFSNQNGVSSRNTSKAFIDKIIDISSSFSKKQLSKEKKERIVKKYHPVVRKLAHFTIYFILGIITYSFLGIYFKNEQKQVVISLIFCFIYACSDEIHQLLLIGRTFQLKDIVIDTVGSGIGIYLRKKLKKR